MQTIIWYVAIPLIACLTWVIAKWVGPWILDLTAPAFARITDKLDRALTGEKDTEYEATVQKVLASTPDELRAKVSTLLEEYGQKSPSSDVDDMKDEYCYNQSISDFFSKYSSLSFSDSNRSLDSSIRRLISVKGTNYIVIGNTEDSGHYYAVKEGDDQRIFLIEINEKDRILSVEEDAPSFEHFVLLQHEMSMLE